MISSDSKELLNSLDLALETSQRESRKLQEIRRALEISSLESSEIKKLSNMLYEIALKDEISIHAMESRHFYRVLELSKELEMKRAIRSKFLLLSSVISLLLSIFVVFFDVFPDIDSNGKDIYYLIPSISILIMSLSSIFISRLQEK